MIWSQDGEKVVVVPQRSLITAAWSNIITDERDASPACIFNLHPIYAEDGLLVLIDKHLKRLRVTEINIIINVYKKRLFVKQWFMEKDFHFFAHRVVESNFCLILHWMLVEHFFRKSPIHQNCPGVTAGGR